MQATTDTTTTSYKVSSLDADNLSIDGYQSWDINSVYADYDDDEIPEYRQYLEALADATCKTFNEIFASKWWTLSLVDGSICSYDFYNYMRDMRDNCEYIITAQNWETEEEIMQEIRKYNERFTVIKFENIF